MTPPNLTPADDRDRLLELIGRHRFRQAHTPAETAADRELWLAAGLQPMHRLPEPIPPRPISLADPRPAADPVNHPTHYTRGPVEVIEIVEGFGLGFRLGNVVKYALRAGHKAGVPPLVDLKKAQWYLAREIALLEALAAALTD